MQQQNSHLHVLYSKVHCLRLNRHCTLIMHVCVGSEYVCTVTEDCLHGRCTMCNEKKYDLQLGSQCLPYVATYIMVMHMVVITCMYIACWVLAVDHWVTCSSPTPLYYRCSDSVGGNVVVPRVKSEEIKCCRRNVISWSVVGKDASLSTLRKNLWLFVPHTQCACVYRTFILCCEETCKQCVLEGEHKQPV